MKISEPIPIYQATPKVPKSKFDPSKVTSRGGNGSGKGVDIKWSIE